MIFGNRPTGVVYQNCKVFLLVPIYLEWRILLLFILCVYMLSHVTMIKITSMLCYVCSVVLCYVVLLCCWPGGFYCPMGWHMGGESCFYFSTEARTWHQSLDYCRANKANLVSILDEQKNKYISGRWRFPEVSRP